MKFFNIDNPVFRTISRIGDIFVLSFLWLVTSIPIFTIGVATTAAYDCAFKIIRARDTNVFKDFFRSFKSNFRQSTLIFLILIPIGALLLFNLYFWAHSESEYSVAMNAVTLGLAVIYLAGALYVFPVQAMFENPIKKTLQTAFLMAVLNIVNTIILLAVCLGVSYVCYIFPIAAYIFLIFGSGLFFMLFAVRFLTVFRKYNPALEPDAPVEQDTVEVCEEHHEKVKAKSYRGKKIIK